ncbi:DUF2917 domain-containing protein [Streptomyces sp. NPDC046324]|uniref:DUF2917 domain-containing protein n=1 Tax=Streptomyces sp. NPDC046324 TaxID=3154915 RepID=UPI0033DCD4B2
MQRFVEAAGGQVGCSRLPVENVGDGDLWLFVEPYGEDHWLKPGEAFTVAPEVEGIGVGFSPAVCQEGIAV